MNKDYLFTFMLSKEPKGEKKIPIYLLSYSNEFVGAMFKANASIWNFSPQMEN